MRTGERSRPPPSSLVKRNRRLRMISKCNQIIFRASSEAEMLADVCNAIVAEGKYKFAWVGYAETDPDRVVRPVAHAGADAKYLLGLDVSWSQIAAGGSGPTGRCIRLRSPQLCGTITDDPAFEPWRERARSFGYSSSIALPMILGSECIGALNIYSDGPQAFDGEELEVLTELAGDIACGIGALRNTQERQRAETQLRLFRDLLDRSNDLIYAVDARSARVLDANDAVTRKLGYSREELLSMSLPELSVSTSKQSWDERLRQIEAIGSRVFEGELRHKDGSTLPVEVSLSYVKHGQTPYLLSVSRDITERLRQQKMIAHMSRIARMQSSINAAVLRIRERLELLQEVARVATDIGGYDRAVVSLMDAGGRTATPVMRSGPGVDFPEPDSLVVGDGTEPDTSLTSRALRTGKLVVANDLTKSEPPVAKREQNIALGYNVLVAMPLIVEGTRIGCLTLASRDPTFVGEDEILLLQDIAATLSFALRQQRQADAFEFLASYDPLTGLAKRALFCSRLDTVLARPATLQDNPLVVAVDVNHLSDINDSYGRHFGDLLLQRIAERLRHAVDSDEHLGYLGGGTFVLIQPQLLTSERNIHAFLEQSVFGEHFAIEGREIRVTCRYGVARYPTDGAHSDTLVQKAEAALKHAKETGEGYLHYKLEIHSKIAERLALENRLRNAIDAREFELRYQPQVNVLTGELDILEALLRWNDPLRGRVLPAEFLPALESSGMIVAVGRWVLKRAVQDILSWRGSSYKPCRVAVNVSAIQLRQRQFVPLVLELSRPLREEHSSWGLDVEITESAMLQDIESTSYKLRELRGAGLRVAIDDFGTGYSALGLLSKLPVDMLKIDRSFVRGLPYDPASVTLARSIIGLASAFGLKTVAEGVETPEQLELLRHLHCDYSQGFLHSEPLTAMQIQSLLSGHPSG